MHRLKATSDQTPVGTPRVIAGPTTVFYDGIVFDKGGSPAMLYIKKKTRLVEAPFQRRPLDLSPGKPMHYSGPEQTAL